MPLYSAISPLLEATQWFKNGDHPDDHSINGIISGRVVRRCDAYRTEDHNVVCSVCKHALGLHGMVGTYSVCPGDYIVTHYNDKGKKVGHSVKAKAEFETRYELYKGPAA